MITAPMITAPMITAPMITAPMITAPMSTAPMSTAPAGTAPLGAATTTTTLVSRTGADTALAGAARCVSVGWGRRRVSVLQRLAGILLATAAMLIGFAVAGSAAPAHADTDAVGATFTSGVACGGDQLVFTANSDQDYGSYAQVWVYDPATEQWVTDDAWVEADANATFNVADLTFEPGYYMVYVAYAQYNGADYDYSGEYVDTYQQYYDSESAGASDYCYMGNDLSLDS